MSELLARAELEAQKDVNTMVRDNALCFLCPRPPLPHRLSFLPSYALFVVFFLLPFVVANSNQLRSRRGKGRHEPRRTFGLLVIFLGVLCSHMHGTPTAAISNMNKITTNITATNTNDNKRI